MAVESAPWQAHALGGLIIVQEPLDLGTRGQGSADSPWHPLRPCGSETTFSVDQTAVRHKSCHGIPGNYSLSKFLEQH